MPSKRPLQLSLTSIRSRPTKRAYFQKVREIAASGVLGKVKAPLDFGGNSIGGHFLDMLLYFLGDPEPVVSIHGTLGELYPVQGDTSNMRFVKDTPILSVLVEFGNSTMLHVAATGARGEFLNWSARMVLFASRTIANLCMSAKFVN